MKDKHCCDGQPMLPLHFEAVTWAKLPEIDLYMDQLLAYLERCLSTCWQQDQFKITSSMVNNYVKHQVIPRPNKKLYSRAHIAYLIIVLTLKTIYNLDEIKEVLCPFYEQEDDLPAFFDWFAARLAWQLKVSQSVSGEGGVCVEAAQEMTSAKQIPVAWPSLQISIEQGIAAYVARQIGLHYLRKSQADVAGAFIQDVLARGQF